MVLFYIEKAICIFRVLCVCGFVYFPSTVSSSWAQEGSSQEGSSQEGSSQDFVSSQKGLVAHLVAVDRAVLSSQIAARITHLDIREGDSFLKGSLLVSFDCVQEEARERHAIASLTGAEKILGLMEELISVQVVSDLEFVRAYSAADLARAELDVVQAGLRWCSLSAPFSGKVARSFVKNHQYVRPADPLIEIVDPTSLEITAAPPSSWLSWLAPGVRFTFVENDTEKEYQAKITRLAATVNSLSRTIRIFGHLDSDDQTTEALLPGMGGLIYFPAAPSP